MIGLGVSRAVLCRLRTLFEWLIRLVIRTVVNDDFRFDGVEADAQVFDEDFFWAGVVNWNRMNF